MHMMKVGPIRTEKDYEAANAEIEALMDAEAGTPDGDQLDVLATLGFSKSSLGAAVVCRRL